MKILPNTQRLGKLTFDSNQVKKSKTNPNVLIAKASDGKDYGVVRKSDGSYDYAGSSRNATFGERLITGINQESTPGGKLFATASTLMAEPQRMMTRALTSNRYNTPSEIIHNTKLPQNFKNVAGFTADMVLDPMSYVGLGLGAKGISKVLNKSDEAFNKMLNRFDNLPELNNPQVSEVLSNFKTRINTPEGLNRLNNLGIKDKTLLDNLKVVEDNNKFGYFWRDKIGLNSKLPEFKRVTRHEIEHAVQENSEMFSGKPTTKIDNLLSNIELKNNPEKVNWNKIKDSDDFRDASKLNEYLSDNKRATNYFASGSDGKEKSAFLGEVQQYMMDKGIIPKTSYTQVTPEMVKNTFTNAITDEKTGGKYLRLFNIMKPTDTNNKLIAESLNKMLGIPAAAVVGSNILSEKKYGGKLNNNSQKQLLPLLNKF
jgi:hypothetical protein